MILAKVIVGTAGFVAFEVWMFTGGTGPWWAIVPVAVSVGFSWGCVLTDAAIEFYARRHFQRDAYL